MTKLEELLYECASSGVHLEEHYLPENINAIFYEFSDTTSIICINKALSKSVEQVCAISEELGHYYTSKGNILTDLKQDKTTIRKQERLARIWAYEKLIPLCALVEAFEAGIQGRHDLAEFLSVTEYFLQECIGYYFDKYGSYKEIDDYIMYFEPLGIFKKNIKRL